jgi:hypothetical protein
MNTWTARVDLIDLKLDDDRSVDVVVVVSCPEIQDEFSHAFGVEKMVAPDLDEAEFENTECTLILNGENIGVYFPSAHDWKIITKAALEAADKNMNWTISGDV